MNLELLAPCFPWQNAQKHSDGASTMRSVVRNHVRFQTQTDRRRQDLCICAKPERFVLQAQDRQSDWEQSMKSSCIGATLPGEWSITEEAEAPILAVREAKSRRRKERRQYQEFSGNKI